MFFVLSGHFTFSWTVPPPGWRTPPLTQRHPFLWSSPSCSRPLSTRFLSNLFISVVKDSRRFHDLSADISVGPHGMRKFAASYSAQVGLNEERVKRVMGFSSTRILRKNYVAWVPPLRVPCVLPGGTFLPRFHEMSGSDSD
ncbi:unnamed protein product [Meganyctiphanes norvegica]|uniref:Uncharacterized protein n=1 Tax=Meganyctiphanes norvegica TaxID=48144 RepID=A0AAV2QS17_MEGNR